jgi:squalene-hopene/tetraprenyl-beta-curcumene cyclase
LLDKQRADGHWCAELQGDTILESEYILLMAFLGREHTNKPIKAARYLLTQQTPEGGWANYPGGPADLSVTVKAYFALKLTGHDSNAPYMRRARQIILSLGGAMGCNSFTRFYLALLGQIPYECCPSVPPEMIFLPRWCYLNIYAMSSWTRTIVIPLSIFYAHKPVRHLRPDQGIAELFVTPPTKHTQAIQPTHRLLTWHNFFLGVDRALKALDTVIGRREKDPQTPTHGTPWEAAPTRKQFPRSANRGLSGSLFSLLTPLLRKIRQAAVDRATRWMLERFEESDGLGAIFPPMIYTVLSLHCLGYAEDSPEMLWALKQLDDLMIEEDDCIRLQPCFSPVWDTGLALSALALVPAADQESAVAQGVQWLLDREVRRSGDWSVLVPGVEPGGWVFEYRNAFYPDTDDTAMVLMALARTGQAWSGIGQRPSMISAAQRAITWLLAMQNSDGGWAAFDRDINHEVLTKIPFADHNAMLDPSCPDITARVLEALGQFGYSAGQSVVDRAIAFIEGTQDRRGCWIGRWGVNYLYGTWQVLQGLRAIHFDMHHPMIRRAVAWLKSVQQPGGGWGETCRSYDDPALAGQGNPTASQTAWALLGLIAAGEAATPEVQAGVRFLLDRQQLDGGWQEEEFTGTGFPKVFYLKYHYYCLYFPLMALARYRQEATGVVTGAGRMPHYRALEVSKF